MNWLQALNDAWDELTKTVSLARQFRTKLISTEMPLDILAGMRASDNAPCLMLQTTLAPEALFELGGMRLSTMPDQSGPFLVLSLEDSSRRDLFSTICADVVSAATRAVMADALEQFLARLDAWRRFLRDRRDGLSRPETIGLIGELLVLEQLLTADPYRLATWQSPDDGLHDFESGGHALEVKAGLGPSSSITISALDQLDTTGLRRLDLLHVRLVEVPGARCLRDIIGAISSILPDDASRRAFDNALLRRGLMPDDDAARLTPKVQQRSIDAYSITEVFPRLSRAALPIAITEATYTLEVRAIAAFAADATAALDAFVQGGASD
ncbi:MULTISPECIES: PD-(D/E)XK motif protein [unclassified Tardiphaga]|uniref:PD-(D/E)XK motif protein n=1 Tax=unclassified Tardiphaga TaxID=2631404 RepID=UPI00143D8617|nr:MULTISPECIES: PD-(D/E)XK motif protein [unclassified Tardiphaga]